MKWALLSVAVFLVSIAVFVAMPRSALFAVLSGMEQTLELFVDGSGSVLERTDGPAAPANDGTDRVESRRRETNQSDLAGRARVIDGDTIEVGTARVRLFGIDAPESAQRCVAGGAAGRVVSRRRGRLPVASTVAPSRAKSVIGTAMGASSPCVSTAGRTSTRGWSARAGRWPIVGTRGPTWMRRRRPRRRSAECGEETSPLPGIGVAANA